jgi:hypothetical protein
MYTAPAAVAAGTTVILAQGGMDSLLAVVKTTTLSAPLFKNQTTATVSSTSGLVADAYIRVGAEIIKITAVVTGTQILTLDRGQLGTTVESHEIGAGVHGSILRLVAMMDNLAVGEYIKTAAGEYMKILALADNGKTLTVERKSDGCASCGSPPGLTQREAAAPAVAGETVTLAEGVSSPELLECKASSKWVKCPACQLVYECTSSYARISSARLYAAHAVAGSPVRVHLDATSHCCEGSPPIGGADPSCAA